MSLSLPVFDEGQASRFKWVGEVRAPNLATSHHFQDKKNSSSFKAALVELVGYMDLPENGEIPPNHYLNRENDEDMF